MGNKMLIAITSEGTDHFSLVAEKFGRSPYIIFFDTKGATFESLKNPYSKLLGGSGIQISQLIIEKNAASLITGEIGSNSFRLLQAAEIRVFLAKIKPVKEILREFNEGKLLEYKPESKINFDLKKQKCRPETKYR